MTDAREAEILRHIPTIRCLDEARGFREQLTAQGEMTGAVMVALKQRMDRIKGDVV
jgi:hypothetical protein